MPIVVAAFDWLIGGGLPAVLDATPVAVFATVSATVLTTVLASIVAAVLASAPATVLVSVVATVPAKVLASVLDAVFTNVLVSVLASVLDAGFTTVLVSVLASVLDGVFTNVLVSVLAPVLDAGFTAVLVLGLASALDAVPAPVLTAILVFVFIAVFVAVLVAVLAAVLAPALAAVLVCVLGALVAVASEILIKHAGFRDIWLPWLSVKVVAKHEKLSVNPEEVSMIRYVLRPQDRVSVGKEVVVQEVVDTVLHKYESGEIWVPAYDAAYERRQFVPKERVWLWALKTREGEQLKSAEENPGGGLICVIVWVVVPSKLALYVEIGQHACDDGL